MAHVQRGMTMRQMDARKLGRQSSQAKARERAQRARNNDEPQGPPPLDEAGESLDLRSDEVLADQGDGTYVARSVCSRGFDDARDHDPPDEAPPGWCDT